MKRTSWLAAALAVLLILATALADTALPKDSLQVQDLYDFNRGGLTVESAGTSGSGDWRRKFRGDKSAVEQTIGAYVRILTSGSYNFEVNREYVQEYKGDKYYSVTLTYTGTGSFAGRGKLEQQFDDGNYGDIMIYYCPYSSRSKNYEGYIYVAKGLEVTDLGLRSDGDHVSVAPAGLSAGAGLVENADGTFSTSDGRLTAGVGQAAVLRDGDPCQTRDISLNRNRQNEKEEFVIEGYCRNEGMVMTFPYRSLMTGDTYGLRQMGQTVFEDGYENKLSGFLTKRFAYIFGICHRGDYLYAHPDPTESIQDLLIRVMLWDEDRGIAVLYIACEVDSAPYLVEALAVFDMNAAATYNGSAERVSMKVGEKKSFAFSDRVYMPNYELYQWEVLEGSANIELTGNRYQECTVTATWEGQARIRVTYTYGTDEPDVLTGKPRNAEKTIQREYLIEITR